MLRGTPEHPKTAALMKKLGICRAQAVGHLEMLWHFASVYAPAGDIGRWPDPAIESACGWEGEPGAMVEALISCRWLDEVEGHRLVVHDWHEHSDRYVRRKVARKGQEIVRVTQQGARGEPKGCPEGTPAGAVAGIQSQSQSQYPEPGPEPATAAPSAPAGGPGAPTHPEHVDAVQLFEAVRLRLSGVIPQESFATWVRGLEADGWDGETFVIAAPSSEAKRWVRGQYHDQIKRAFIELGHSGPLRIMVRARDPATLHDGTL
jgi:hypothetical protein